MKPAAPEEERARAIIRSVCQMLASAQAAAPVFVGDREELRRDLAVLLHDLTRWYCRAVSARLGEPPAFRWSPELSEALLARPEQWEQVLARVAAEPWPAAGGSGRPAAPAVLDGDEEAGTLACLGQG